jgi:hypothetical protein
MRAIFTNITNIIVELAGFTLLAPCFAVVVLLPFFTPFAFHGSVLVSESSILALFTLTATLSVVLTS